MKNQRDFPYKYIMNKFESTGDNYYDIGFKYAGPILFLYTWWVLLEAQKKGIKRLYFIARDGYPLYEIANIFVKKFNLDIECKYLYCSRKALILPSINESFQDELVNLTKYSAKSTINILLDRIDATIEQKKIIINDLENNNIKIDIDKILTISEHQTIQNILVNSSVYINILKSNASINYNLTVSYLKQEGLYDNNLIYIVDIGWAGSIQKYLEKIINIESPNAKIFAFYFGTLYSKYLKNNEHKYKAWYFDNKKHHIARAMFSVNIMESICTAPHGTTKAYENINNIYKPILDNINHDTNTITKKINEGLLDFTNKIIIFTNFEDFKNKTLHKAVFKICYELMFAPSKALVSNFSKFAHCDDITNSYIIRLVEEDDINSLYYYQLPVWLYYKLTKKSFGEDFKTPMWPYGVIANMPFIKRVWYRLNLLLIYYVRYKKLID